MMKLSLVVLALASVAVRSFCPAPARLHASATLVLREQKLNKNREWIEKDMQDAGKAEHETEDWVAEDMERLGSQSGEAFSERVGDWVAKDMVETGRAHEHRKLKKADDTLKNKKNWDIAKDMKRTGKATDWIARDMEEAGRPDARTSMFSTEHWFNSKLDQELDRLKEDRKDTRKDIEKTGHLGSSRDEEVRSDMENTGKAKNPFEALQDFFESVTYKLSEWTEKAFNEKKISEEMQETGKASDQTWLKHDLEAAGREGVDHGRALPEQKTELVEDLTEATHEEYIAKDMAREGKAGGTFTSTRKAHDRNRLVSEDMKVAGLGGSFSEEQIRRDMETAGHAGKSFGGGFASWEKVNGSSPGAQYQQELKQFQEMKHSRPKAPVEPGRKLTIKTTAAAVKAEDSKLEDTSVDSVVEKVETPKEENHEGFARHLLKKVRHPRTPWKDL